MTFGNLGAEEAVLAAMVEKPEWREKLFIDLLLDDFTNPNTRALFLVLQKMIDNNEVITTSTVTSKGKALNDAGWLCGCNEITLSAILSSVPLRHELDGFLTVLKEMTKRRKIMRAVYDAEIILNKDGTSAEAFSVIEKLIIDNSMVSGLKREYYTPSLLAKHMRETLDKYLDSKLREKEIIRTGIKKLDTLMGGLMRGDLVIISGQTGAGKSACVMNLCIDMMNAYHALYINSEMKQDIIDFRLMSILSQVCVTNMIKGNLTDDEKRAAIISIQRFKEGLLHVLTMPDMLIEGIIVEARRIKKLYGVDVLVVDYIGRMDYLSARKDAQEWQMLYASAKRLKSLAVELDAVVIMIAQAKEDGYLAKAKHMADEADLWLNLVKIKEEDLFKTYPWNYMIEFKKGRNIQLGKQLPLFFNGSTVTFTDDDNYARLMNSDSPST